MSLPFYKLLLYTVVVVHHYYGTWGKKLYFLYASNNEVTTENTVHPWYFTLSTFVLLPFAIYSPLSFFLPRRIRPSSSYFKIRIYIDGYHRPVTPQNLTSSRYILLSLYMYDDKKTKELTAMKPRHKIVDDATPSKGVWKPFSLLFNLIFFYRLKIISINEINWDKSALYTDRQHYYD